MNTAFRTKIQFTYGEKYGMLLVEMLVGGSAHEYGIRAGCNTGKSGGKGQG